ncbi:MAG: hypothetical protein DSM106950_00415 [Stigonema ocellatum SAG 48.90 = DSM 106950]|nr:hypothetical protein [Stigonema ocellatum SAG 48.90 = DSM 106950]
MIAVVADIEPEELTEEESCLRLHLERQVEKAFYLAGIALQELRDKRLYRFSHKTFEEYCRDRFGHSRQKSNYLIAAAGVFENLTTNCCQNLPTKDLTTNRLQILPTNEGQVRSLTKLEPALQRQVWQQAVQEAGGMPSGRIVKDIVQRITQRTKVPNPYRVGEVCQFVVKDNPDLRGKSGSWCIVKLVNEFSCTVITWDGEYILKMEHLKSFEYSDTDCEQMQQVCLRITNLRNSGKLEDAAMSILKQLGEVKRPYVTPLEEKLLGLLEQEYGIAARISGF